MFNWISRLPGEQWVAISDSFKDGSRRSLQGGRRIEAACTFARESEALESYEMRQIGREEKYRAFIETALLDVRH
jgi:hypothetical protein